MPNEMYDPAALDASDTLDGDPGDDPLDQGVAPPDKWSAGEGFGTTAEEEQEGESLDQLLAEEEPDPYADSSGGEDDDEDEDRRADDLWGTTSRSPGPAAWSQTTRGPMPTTRRTSSRMTSGSTAAPRAPKKPPSTFRTKTKAKSSRDMPLVTRSVKACPKRCRCSRSAPCSSRACCCPCTSLRTGTGSWSVTCSRQPEPRRFGVVAIREGRETGFEGVSALYEIGCTATLRRVSERDDGGYDLVTVGADRFRLIALDDSKPYFQGEVEFLPENAGGEAAASIAVQAVQRAFHGYAEALNARGATQVSIPELPGDPARAVVPGGRVDHRRPARPAGAAGRAGWAAPARRRAHPAVQGDLDAALAHLDTGPRVQIRPVQPELDLSPRVDAPSGRSLGERFGTSMGGVGGPAPLSRRDFSRSAPRGR